MSNSISGQYTRETYVKQQQDAAAAEAQLNAKRAAAEQEIKEQSLFLGINKDNFAKNINIFEEGKEWSTEFKELGGGLLDVPGGLVSMFGSILKGVGSIFGGIGTGAQQANATLQAGQPKPGQPQAPQPQTPQPQGQPQTPTTTSGSTPSSFGSLSKAGSSSSTSTVSQNQIDGAVRIIDGERDSSIITLGLENTNSAVRAAVEEYNNASKDVEKFTKDLETAAGKVDEAKLTQNENSKTQAREEARASYLGEKITSLSANIEGQERILASIDKSKDSARYEQVEANIKNMKEQLKGLQDEKDKAEENAAKAKKAAGSATITDAEKAWLGLQTKLEEAQKIQSTCKTNVEEAVKEAAGTEVTAENEKVVGEQLNAKMTDEQYDAAKKQTEEESRLADKAEAKAKARPSQNNTIKLAAQEALKTGNHAKPSYLNITDDEWNHQLKIANGGEVPEKKQSTGTARANTPANANAQIAKYEAEWSEMSDDEKAAYGNDFDYYAGMRLEEV